MSAASHSFAGPVDSRPVADVIASVQGGHSESLGELLQVYRHYLEVLAKTQLDRRLRRRRSTSDLVQETMLAAHRDFAQFRGQSEAELLGWLRQILVHCLSHAVEKNITAKKRDLRREVAMDQVSKKLDDSMARLSHIIEDKAPSPSQVIARRELATELSEQLAKLKPAYRDVIVFRNMQGLSFDEVADRMQIKSGAARMLWMRAIAKFKEVCDLNPEFGS